MKYVISLVVLTVLILTRNFWQNNILELILGIVSIVTLFEMVTYALKKR
jgi:hypothetical protein